MLKNGSRTGGKRSVASSLFSEKERESQRKDSLNRKGRISGKVIL